MARIIAWADDSIFFSRFFKIHRSRLGKFENGHLRSILGNLFVSADLTGKIFRIPRADRIAGYHARVAQHDDTYRSSRRALRL
ncbi:hypothetical protein [Burkholderia ambifaria]|uniref:hypothetical protein n=1 Tax=Burkholderia ambifaria TaxID=152480 RepID=UPI001C933B12|nr:hypothetical protein [Burkholderia ambifaria]MBY4769890.1 hypothetical protein [Burkholderia ambifaria]